MTLERNKSKTILIVDDSFVVREQLKDILHNRNYTVLEAKNAKEALEIIHLNKIDLMLLDLELEESNGYDFLIKNRDVVEDGWDIEFMLILGNI